jgi:hypothetical protein
LHWPAGWPLITVIGLSPLSPAVIDAAIDTVIAINIDYYSLLMLGLGQMSCLLGYATYY